MLIRWFCGVVVLGVFLGSSRPAGAEPAALRWPKESNLTKPWTFWHWMGNAVDEANLSAELEKLNRCGLGGVLVVQIQTVRDPKGVMLPYLSTQSVAMLMHTIRQARALGMDVDLCPTTGWSWGGPWVKREWAGSKINVRTFTVKAGGRLGEAVDNERSDVQSVMAYSGDGQKLDLLGTLDGRAQLDWTAPPDRGDWTVYAVVLRRGSCRVRYPTADGDGWVVDYLSAASMLGHLGVIEKAFAFEKNEWPRGWYDDSWEADMNWSDDGMNTFQKLRGYDLREYLPEYLGAKGAEIRARVNRDFLLTGGEMMLEGFFNTASRWANEHGSKLACETIDHPGNILDMAAASDIPFADVGGGQDWWFPGGRYDFGANFFTRHKIQSSAAHIVGRPLVASETITCWVGPKGSTDCMRLGFETELKHIKWKVDLDLLGGVNHTMFHSMSYSPAHARWPGYIFGAETQCGPFNPYWPHLADLNRYISRCQAFLQAGKPGTDLLFFYPYDDLAMAGRNNYAHFDIDKRLYEDGYDLDYVSERMIMDKGVVRVSRNKLVSPGSVYKALVIGGCKYMDAATLQRIFDLAKAGATVVVCGEFPDDVPGFFQFEERRAQLQELVRQFEASARATGGVTRMQIGSGQILKGSDLRELMTAAGVSRESMVDEGLRCIRRRDAFGTVYFIASPPGNKAVSGWVPFGEAGKSAVIFDAATGVSGMAACTNDNGQFKVYLQVEPAGSLIVRVLDRVVKGAAWKYANFGADAVPIRGTWEVTFVDGGENLPSPEQVAELSSWTTWNASPQSEELKWFSGLARYSITFDRPAGDAAEWYLDLGEVRNSARVTLNGTNLGTVYGAPNCRVKATGALKPAGNRLEVEVANLAVNRIVHLDNKGIAWRLNPGLGGEIPKFNQGFIPLESGLIGPVKLVPVRETGVK